MKCVGGNIHNTDLQHDSDEVKGCIKCKYPCTARLNGLNRDILWHKKESGETPTSAFIDTILDLARRDSWFWQA